MLGFGGGDGEGRISSTSCAALLSARRGTSSKARRAASAVSRSMPGGRGGEGCNDGGKGSLAIFKAAVGVCQSGRTLMLPRGLLLRCRLLLCGTPRGGSALPTLASPLAAGGATAKETATTAGFGRAASVTAPAVRASAADTTLILARAASSIGHIAIKYRVQQTRLSDGPVVPTTPRAVRSVRGSGAAAPTTTEATFRVRGASARATARPPAADALQPPPARWTVPPATAAATPTATARSGVPCRATP